MKLNIWTITFLTGLIFSFSSLNKAVTVADNPFNSVDFPLESCGDLLPKDKSAYPVVVPTYIPPGFKVDKLEVIDNDSEKIYKIIYRNSNNLCFYIADGIDSILSRKFSGLSRGETARRASRVETVKVNLPVIDTNSYLSINKYDRASTSSSISLESSKVEFESPCTEKDRAITTPEAVKIVESLQYLNP
ncbi:MAG: hypothetical protein F6K48_34260 [Okeania sp. SIO3H1]|uniref:hypothetical protein n=1 Tax=Okeania sp. SIO1I7 TaxID=2607772 RepID=UPI0013CA5CE0|nr:hypothetical protein [Okeania sp. SIO1I7]NEN93665.1 hypothetical protein [Okeania sp. SIO3H1]NET28681.1 hypothetical protein [Okeania sp. SIO1I7]